MALAYRNIECAIVGESRKLISTVTGRIIIRWSGRNVFCATVRPVKRILLMC